jgi:asparagine synthase (glutamine-hydrolysing)
MMTALADEMLTKVDRCTSAVSIEGRVPFLDVELAEFALKIPLKHKFNGKVGKLILREALAKLLPKEILWGQKRGFSVPMDRWVKEQAPDIERQLIGESSQEFRQFFRTAEIKNILDMHRRHNPRYGHHIWALMQFNEWLAQRKAT